MPRIPVDPADIRETIEPGWHIVRIISGNLRTGAESGNGYVAWQLEVLDPSNPENHGHKLFVNTPYEGPGDGIYKSFVRAAGLPEEGQKDTEDFINVEIEVQTEHDEYQGRVRDSVINFRKV